MNATLLIAKPANVKNVCRNQCYESNAKTETDVDHSIARKRTSHMARCAVLPILQYTAGHNASIGAASIEFRSFRMAIPPLNR